MKRTSLAIAQSLVLCCAGSASGQVALTAQDVRLAAGVAIGAREAYVQRGGDAKAVGGLIEDGQKAAASDRIAAYRAFTRAYSIASRRAWTAEAELATALDVALTAVLIERDRPIAGRISFLFAGPAVRKPPYRVKLEVAGLDGRVEAKGPRVPIGDPAAQKAGARFEFEFAAGMLAPGSHILRAVLENGDGEAVFTYDRPIVALGGPGSTLTALEKEAAALGNIDNLCATTARYIVESARRATRSYDSVPFGGTVAYVFTALYRSLADMGWTSGRNSADPVALIARARELIRAARSGKDILAGMTGDLRLAYRSTADRQIVPFRIYVPSTYDRTRPVPLVVTLHGSGADENSFFDGYKGRWIAQSEKYGYILASPNGRGPTSGFTVESGGQQDVLDVIALVRGRYNIDPAMIFLTGHSMGGSGTIRVAARTPDLFAAVAPIAGMPTEAETWKALEASRKIPMLVIAGGKDATVSSPGRVSGVPGRGPHEGRGSRRGCRLRVL